MGRQEVFERWGMGFIETKPRTCHCARHGQHFLPGINNLMNDDELRAHEEKERRKARLLEEAVAAEARAAAARAEAAALDRQFFDLQQLASELGFTVVPKAAHGLCGYNGSVSSLIDAFTVHPDSAYGGIRHATRKHYDRLMRRIGSDCAGLRVSDLSLDRLNELHQQWSRAGLPMAHALVTMLRGLATFGHQVLKADDCTQLRMDLHIMKVPVGTKERTQALTEAQALDIIRAAHEMDLHSMALAQSFQFGCKLTQKDVIGEWVPVSEHTGTPSGYIRRDKKWVRGICWNEIDMTEKILRHPASNGGRLIERRLSDIPMVMDELARYPRPPATGALILREHKNRKIPWDPDEFRRKWREVATAAGVPAHIRNVDSRHHDDGPLPEEIEETDKASEMRR